MSITKKAALQQAFDDHTSDSDGLTAAEAMALSEDDWNKRITHWEPFEDWEVDDLRQQIEATAQSLLLRFGEADTETIVNAVWAEAVGEEGETSDLIQKFADKWDGDCNNITPMIEHAVRLALS